MKIITLLTDFGTQDNFVGVMKGVALRINPDVNIVDISHNVRAHDIFDAAFLLSTSYEYFPKNTIHVVVVDPGVGSQRNVIAVKTTDYYFLAPDNGVLSFALKKQEIEAIINVENDEYFLKPLSNTFHGRDIFCAVAAHLSKGVSLDSLGPTIKNIHQIHIPAPLRRSDVLIGQIVYIDRFGNLVTNVDKEALEGYACDFKIKVGDQIIHGLNKTYSDAPNQTPVALIDSFGYLEIAVNGANAKDYFGLDKKDLIEIFQC